MSQELPLSTVNMREAKRHLSRLVRSIQQGEKREIVIAQLGRAIARLVRVNQPQVERRLGAAKGLFEVPEDIDAHNEELARQFGLGASQP